MCLGLVVSWSLCAYGVLLHILDTPVLPAAVSAEEQKDGAINTRPQHNRQLAAWQYHAAAEQPVQQLLSTVTCGHD
jgi:hypothetical protein